MTSFPSRRVTLAAVCATSIGLLAGACGSSSSNNSSSTTTGSGGGTTAATTPAATVPGGTLNGSGSTFQAPFDQDAISAFTKLHSGVTINYAGGGSAKGQTDLASKLVDFAGTDSIPKNVAQYASGGGLLFFPTVIGPITLSYNLSGVKNLTLSASNVAQIYSGKVTKWNDPSIAKNNPGVTLPGETIVPVHRSDGSGTTSNFTKYLTKADPTDWTLGSSSTVNWPGGGQAGNGNPGVGSIVGKTSGAIGYVDYSDAVASNLTFASVINSSGKAVAPSPDSASAAADGVTIAANLTYDPTNSSNPAAYPITSPTWIIVYKTQGDPTKAAILKGFLQYLLTTAQGTVAKQDDYAPLPSALQQQAISQLSQL